jgi:large subunit ribosomal protein L4
VTEDIRFDSPKTKQFVQMLEKFKVDGSVLMIVDKMHHNLMLSARNLPKVKTINVDNINIYDLLRYDWVIISQESVERLHSGVTENE